MARKNKKAVTEFVLFNVVYEDGSQSSNRKVPGDELGGLDGDLPAKEIIEAQDRKIAELSGQARPAIKSLKRAGGR